MRSPRSFCASALASALLLTLSACGAPDLIVTAAGLPPEARWLDLILWQLSGTTVQQQTVASRQLIDVSARGGSPFYKVGLKLVNREPTYALFVAAFKDDGRGRPCLLNTASALQDPGWVLVGDVLAPFFQESALPPGACFQPANASASWPTEGPFIALASVATTAFDGKEPLDIAALRLRGWNFMLGDTVSPLFYMPSSMPKVSHRVINPELIDWSVQPTDSTALTVQDLTVERSDKSARHTVTLSVALPNLL